MSSENSISNILPQEEEDLYFSQPDYIYESDDDILSSTTVVVDYELAEPIVIEGEFFDALQVATITAA